MMVDSGDYASPMPVDRSNDVRALADAPEDHTTSVHLRRTVAFIYEYLWNPIPSPPLPSVVSRRNKREKNRTRSFHFPPNFAGGNTTRSRVFSSPTRRSRRRRRSSSVAVEFNQLGYSSLNFQRWKRIAAMQG
ncbi:hypothetical protein AAC387_Pa06g0355 [Persea americana]